MFLPISMDDMRARGWDSYDFLLVSADAYVDHSSFGHAVIARVLESRGYRVAILACPRYDTTEDFEAFAPPRLGVLISCGNLDSMVSNYTAAKKRRHDDRYAPGGIGNRPDRCAIVYANLARRVFPDLPIILGGIEPSLRRFAHYDYWDNKVRRSVLFDSRAPLLIYGMGERQIVELADALAADIPISQITWVRGTAYIASEAPQDAILLPSYETIQTNKQAYAEAARLQYEQQNPYVGKALAQPHGNRFLIQNPPALPLSEAELDEVYELPYMREPHPSYKEGVPAIEEVRFSITVNRGCFGSCNFCSLAFHQGRVVQSRSVESVVREGEAMTHHPAFKGYIHDVGGPTANFTVPACDKQKEQGACPTRQCLFPKPCPNLRVDHRKYMEMLRRLRALPGVKKVFIRSGIRYDYLLRDRDNTFFKALCAHHISGQLRVAPEHVSENVLRIMGKPSAKLYDAFVEKFAKINGARQQFIVPYLMSGHPGSTMADAVALANYLETHHIHPEQVQDFYPTPGTISTAMFYTGIHPLTGEAVYVPRTPEEKATQRALLQPYKTENRRLVQKALQRKEETHENFRRKDGVGAHKGRPKKRG